MPKQQISLKARAIRYLSMREHSRQELARKLYRHAQEGEDVDALLDALQAAKYLSEERFSEALIHRRTARFGNSRILSELKNHGVTAEAIDAARAGMTDETERATTIWQRKFGKAPGDANERAKQMRFLLQRGFSQATIRKVLSAAGTAVEDATDDED